jgi:Mor family transcriptional regulator
MKKSFFATLFFALSTLATASTSTIPRSYTILSNTKVLVKTKLVKKGTFQLQIANMDGKYTYVSLTDLNGNRIYFSEGINKRESYLKNINIKNLTDGKYILKVTSNGETIYQIIKIKSENILFSHLK